MGLPSVLDEPAAQRSFLEAVRLALCDLDDPKIMLHDALVKHVTERLGALVADDLMRWGHETYLYTHEDLPHWSAWLMLLQLVTARRYNDLHLPAEQRRAFYTAFAQQMDVSDIVNQKRAYDQSSPVIDDWDVMILAKYQWPAEDPDSGPFSRVLTLVEMNRFQRLVRDWTPKLSSEEHEQLLDSGRALVRELGIWLPSPLVGWPVIIAPEATSA